MTLENLLRIGKLKAHVVGRVEIERLFASADRALRDAGEPGHHQLLIQSLPKSAGVDPARIKLLDALRTLRNKADYSGEPVSDAVAWEAVEEARRLVAEVREWIRANRPELT